MRHFFKKDDGFYRCYTTEIYFNKSHTIRRMNMNKLKSDISDNFESVKFKIGTCELFHDLVYFGCRFTDEADEAAFILWSNDGIRY
jgi:hypothetical protein